MGKQIEFIIDEKTEQDFHTYLKSEGFSFFIRSNNNIEEVNVFPLPFSCDFWYTINLYKNNFGELIIKETKNNIKYIDKLISPIIEYSRGVVLENNKTISKARLWVEVSYYDNKNILKNKSKYLNDYFKILSKWIKNNLKLDEINSNGYTCKLYVTDSMKDFIENNGYTIL
jgi:hypothetical protein